MPYYEYRMKHCVHVFKLVVSFVFWKVKQLSSSDYMYSQWFKSISLMNTHNDNMCLHRFHGPSTWLRFRKDRWSTSVCPSPFLRAQQELVIDGTPFKRLRRRCPQPFLTSVPTSAFHHLFAEMTGIPGDPTMLLSPLRGQRGVERDDWTFAWATQVAAHAWFSHGPIALWTHLFIFTPVASSRFAISGNFFWTRSWETGKRCWEPWKNGLMQVESPEVENVLFRGILWPVSRFWASGTNCWGFSASGQFSEVFFTSGLKKPSEPWDPD